MDELPQTVRTWLSLLGKRGDGVDAERRALLADDASLVFAGGVTHGADAIVAQQGRMGGGAMPPPEWEVVGSGSSTEITVRGRFAGGGGPNGLTALDLVFALDERGRIRRLAPMPQHREPGDLKPFLGIGAVAPGFTLPDTDGNPVALLDGLARVTLVVWTSNHCPWALAWHDRLQRVAKDYSGRVRFLQVNANDPAVSPHDALSRCRDRITSGEMATPYLIDGGQTAARAWGARHTPEAFVLEADGRVVYHGAPDADHRDAALDARWLRQALDSALARHPPAVAETTPVGCTIKWTFGGSDRTGTAPPLETEAHTGHEQDPRRVELLYWTGCPSHGEALRLLQGVMTEYGLDAGAVEQREIITFPEAVAEGFVGSPTIRVGGMDIVPVDGEAPGLTCRIYRHADGRIDPLPEASDIRAALAALHRS